MDNREKSRIQKEIVDSLPNPCHGILKLAPRVGKTKITIDIIKRDKPKRILWVTPNRKLRDVDIPGEFITWRAKTYLKKTTIICYAALAKHRGDYDLVILDEYQDLTSNNAKPILSGSIKYNTIIGLSGTHPKHKEKLELYNRLNLDILIDISIDEAVEKKLVAPYNITVVQCQLDSKDKYVKGGSKTKPFLQTEKSRYEFMTKGIARKYHANGMVPQFYYINRMRFLYNLKSKNKAAKTFVDSLEGRTLVFTGGIDMAERLYKHTFHSKTDDTDLNNFLAGGIKSLACVNAGGVGFTFKGVDNFVIVQINSNQKGDATQKIARALVPQEGYVGNIYIFVVKDTVDEGWLEEVLKDFSLDKVKYVRYEDL